MKLKKRRLSTTSALLYIKYMALVSLVSAIPILALVANNLAQVQPLVAMKPLLVTLLITWVLFSAFYLLLRSPKKSSLIIILLIVIFFYSEYFNSLLKRIDLFGIQFTDKHTCLLLGLVFLLLLFLIFRAKKISENLFGYFALVAALMVVFNLAQIFIYQIKVNPDQKKAALINAIASEENIQPDIYYIVLDAYAREDILQELYQFDNSTFLQQLRKRGFFIPECALSNYEGTINSIASVMNMNYLSEFEIPTTALRRVTTEKAALIQNNLVWQTFADMGYQFVTARGYAAFNDIRNSDIYLNFYESQGQEDKLSERLFLNLLLDTSLLQTLDVAQSDTFPTITTPLNQVDTTSLAYEEAFFWYRQTEYVFDALAEFPEKPGNFLVYAHINSPHGPFVVNENGDFSFTNETNDDLRRYPEAVRYLNKQVLELVDILIGNSVTPPVIIIQADHGSHNAQDGIDKHKFLSSYYLPGNISIQPYDTLTPVNNFRLILHNYFDETVTLLPDLLFVRENKVYETLPATCTP